MKKSLGFMAALLLFAAIAAPNASADSLDPCKPATKPGGTFVLGTPGKHLTDSADLGLLCSYPGTLTFKVSGDAIFVPLEFTVDVKGPGSFPIEGPVPEAAATFTWSVTYTPKGGKPSDAVFEKQVVTTPEPGTGTLVLLGVVFLLVTWKRCALGLTPTR
jgi:hypothetical protein